MVKKCLIAIAVVAMLATTVQAATVTIDGAAKFEGTWPWTKTYEPIDICTFPVYLEVGHYVQIENCGDLEMKLNQVACEAIGKNDGDHFPCYGEAGEPDGPACVTITARANFVATLGASFAGSDTDIVGGHALTWPDGKEIPGDGASIDLKLCMTAWSVALWNSGATSGEKKVGSITLSVKPQDETGGSW